MRYLQVTLGYANYTQQRHEDELTLIFDKISVFREGVLQNIRTVIERVGAPCYQNPDNLSLTRKELPSGAFRVIYTPSIFFAQQHRETTIIAGLSRSHYTNLLPRKSKISITAAIQHRRTYSYLFLSPLSHPLSKRNKSPLDKSNLVYSS